MVVAFRDLIVPCCESIVEIEANRKVIESNSEWKQYTIPPTVRVVGTTSNRGWARALAIAGFRRGYRRFLQRSEAEGSDEL
eukprot:scaffold28638_cov38-Attheya_sp.AAC.2